MRQTSLFNNVAPIDAGGMTALHLAEDIFRRAQPALPGNVRRISRKQLDYLRSLIEGEYPPAARQEQQGKLTWLPAGRDKYVITEDRFGDKHLLMKLSNLTGSGEGKLS